MSAESSFEDLEVDAAKTRLRGVLRDLGRARSLLRHAGIRAAGAFPPASRNLATLDALAVAAEEGARAGLAGMSAASELGIDGDAGLGAIYRDGRLSLETLADVRRAIEEASQHIERAMWVLENAPKDVLGSIRSGRAAANRLVRATKKDLERTKTVIEDLPGLLGGEGRRRYFLAFQAPSESRGGGGLIGVYGVLEANDGRLELEEVAPIRDLVKRLRGEVSAPGWYRGLYANVDGLGGWREANSSPTFPTVARILLRMYKRSTGEALDGVLTIDPVVVAELLKGIGPIDVEGMPKHVTAQNAERLLMRDIYVRFEGREDDQNAFLRDLVDQVWERFSAGEIEPRTLARSLTRSIAGQRLKFFSAHPSEADGLAALGIDGDPTRFGPRVQMVFHNNFAANKIDWYLHRAQHMKIVLDEDGSARVLTEMSLRNDAPVGHRSLLKKSDVNELPSGLNLMSLHFMLPENARVENVYFGSSLIDAMDGREAGRFPEVWAPLQLRVQDEAEVTVSYTVPNMVRFKQGRGRFDMTFLPQALVRPDGFSLELVVPSGYRIGRAGKERVEFAGMLDRPRNIRMGIRAPGIEPPVRHEPALSCDTDPSA